MQCLVPSLHPALLVAAEDPSTTASMLAFLAFHIASYHFTACLFGPGLFDLNAVLDVCFDAQFSCSHAQVQRLWMRRLTPTLTPTPTRQPQP